MGNKTLRELRLSSIAPKQILTLIIAAVAVIVSGCMQSPPELSPALISRLTGSWYQSATNSSVRFFEDQTVKLSLHLPGRHDPIQLLSTYEPMQDGAIAISLGNAWRGPARITFSASKPHNTLLLHLPGKNKGEETLFELSKAVSATH
ncbi:MAG: hypothetical protein Q9M26_05210 [Mariprofundales bacterium]|nr:hypothetical protein [Mariprofundales bacterium]